MRGTNGCRLGITPPLCVAQPTPGELEKTKELLTFLRETAQVYEKKDEIDHRRRVLSDIYQLACNWVKAVAGPAASCCLFTFGSFRLGTGGPQADVDALLVVPREITREQFFADWERMLHDRRDYVSKAIAVPAAFVPIIKFVWRDVDVDLLFATMDRCAITPQLDLASDDDRALEYVHDETSVRSLNGVRVADRILRLVPSVPVFRVALRFIKHWAKRRGIYSNAIGFLGGITWALLVARVCQLYPNACGYTIIKQFFIVFSKWKWPNPVLLVAPSDAAKRLNNGAALSMPQWDGGANYRDRLHLMPVLTPAFPSQNSTFNVGPSTFRIINSEIQRGESLIAEDSRWFERLCEPSNFFTEFATFLRIDAFVTESAVASSSSSSSTSATTTAATTASSSATVAEGAERDVVCDEKTTKKSEKMKQVLANGLADMDTFMIDSQKETYVPLSSSSSNGVAVATAAVSTINGGSSTASSTASTSSTNTMSEYERDAWYGWVESRLRFLTCALESTLHVDLVRPFPKPFSDESPNKKTYFFGLKFAPKTIVVGQKTKVDISAAVNDFQERVMAQRPSALVGCTVTNLNQNKLPHWAKA